MTNKSRIHIAGVFVVWMVVGLVLGVVVWLSTQPAHAQTDAWRTYTSADAAYTFDYPDGTTLTESDDASLRFKIVYAQLPVTATGDYQGVSILVLENPGQKDVTSFVAERSAITPGTRAVAPRAMTVDGRDALWLERDTAVGDGDKYTVLVPGDGVIYRINLYGGGVGGPVEPAPETESMFNRLVASFRVLNQPLKPSTLNLQPPTFNPLAEPPVATVFTYPLRTSAGIAYGVPVGIVISDTHLEWLGYAIRNLDQWRIKCYGVDWARMLHTGEDWYRLDGVNTAGAPVYAIADGVVAKHNPGISYPGNVVMIRHRLPDGRNIYSMYGHVSSVSVVEGQLVSRGQRIASVISQSYVGRTPSQHLSTDAHLHFEMRWFLDGTNIYVPGTNAYGYNYPGCTYAYPGRGYTYLIHPDDYPYPDAGYVAPTPFISARLDQPSGCQPSELLVNGGFESGLPGAPWTATNSQGRNDPLIYQTRPHSGAWGGWLGNVLNYTDTLAQVVVVPGNSVTLTLSFWRYVTSAEPAGNGDDRMTVRLTGPDGANVMQPIVLTSAVARNAWTRVTLTFTLNGYAHPTATLSLTGINDGDNVSSFFVDDVFLLRLCPGAAVEGTQAVTTEAAGVADDFTPPSKFAAQEAQSTQAVSRVAFLPVLTRAPGVVCADALGNGNFESALPGRPWVGVANTTSAIVNDAFIYTTRPRTGARSGRVGSPTLNSYWNEMLQTVQLPAAVISISLTYWRYLDTDETSTTVVYDRFSAGVETQQGIEIVTPQRIDNTSAGRGTWVQHTLNVPNSSLYSGQRVWVSFKANTDSNLPSSLYVDDAQLVVCALR